MRSTEIDFVIKTNKKTNARHVLLKLLLLGCMAWGFFINAARGQTTLTIGTGTTSYQYLPIYTYYDFTYSQSTYLNSEIVAAGATAATPGFISSISYYVNTYTAGFPGACKDWVIYMGNTSKTTFSGSSDWVPLSSLTKVYDGIVNPTATGYVKITFPTPFYWDGISNLVVAVDENTPAYFGSTWRWRVTTRTGTRSICHYRDADDVLPSSPPAANVTYGGTPNIQITYTPALPCAGTTVGGTTVSTLSSSCPGASTTLTVTGATSATGLTYSWESGPSATGPWTTMGGGTDMSITTFPTGGATTYYRRLTKCTATGSSAYSAVVSVTIPLAPDPPYIENFESATVGVNRPCASFSGSWGDGSYWYIRNSIYCTNGNHTPGGTKYLFAGWSFYSTPQFWFTPGIKLKTGKTYRFSYWYANDGDNYYNPYTGAYLGTSQTVAAMTPIGPTAYYASTVQKEYVTDFTVAAEAVYFAGIKVLSTGSCDWTFDDINLIELPACNTATAATFTAPGKASASPSVICSLPGSTTLSLSGTPAYSGLTFSWERCVGTPTFSAASSVTTIGSTALLSNSITVAGSYFFRCKITCSATGFSGYSDTVKVSTTPIEPPYIETFESGSAGTNMPCASYTYAFGYTWSWNVMASVYGKLNNHTTGGSKYLIAGGDLGYWSGATEYWFSPAIKFTAGKLYQFSYWYKTDAYVGTTYTLGAYMGLSQSVAGMTIPLGGLVSTSTASYKQFKYQFTAATSGNYYLAVSKNASSYGDGVAIDDIGLQEVPPCNSGVTAGKIIGEPFHVCNSGGTAILDLEGSTLATGLTYEWFTAPKESGPYVSVGLSPLPYNTDPLLSTTWFKAVVKCMASGSVDTSKPYKIGVGAFDLPYSEDFESTPAGGVPTCSDATKWSATYYEGWNVLTNGWVGGPYNSRGTGNQFLMGGYFLGSPSSPSEDNYWFTPGFNLKSGYSYKLSFYYLGLYSSGTAKMGVYLGKSQTPGAMSTQLVKYRNITNSSYLLSDTVFSVPANGIYYLGFRKSGANPSSTYTYEGVAFDDINLNYGPCNGMPLAGNIISDKASGTPFCNNTPIKLTNIGATISAVPGIKYLWQRKSLSGSGGWTFIAGANDTVLSGTNLTGFDYRMAVVCSNTKDTALSSIFSVPQIPDHPPVAISPASTPAVYCLGDTVKFSATNFSGALYEWMLDSTVVSGWKFSDMGATEPGTYMVKVTSGLSPCPAYSNQVKLNINDPGYEVSITTPADSIICAGSSVLLSGLSSKPGVTYQWRRNNVNIPGAVSSSLLVTGSGYYRLTASDGASSCAAVSRSVLITVKPNPPAILKVPGGTTTACAETGVLLEANSGSFSYEWLRSGSTVAGWKDSAQLITNSGTYSVKVRTADGCVGTSAPVTVNILPSPVPAISKTGLVLSVVPPSFLSYQWMRDGKDIPGAIGSSFTMKVKGLYKVKVKDANGCTGESAPIDAQDFDLTGIDNVTVKADEIRIYPNPTMSKVFVESPVSLNIEVKDVAGKSILKVNDAKEIDMSKYADGVYLFIISSKDEILKQQRVTKTSR